MTREVALTRQDRDERDLEMYRLYSIELWTLRDLSDEFGLDKGHIGHIFSRRGWPRRKPGPVPPKVRETD